MSSDSRLKVASFQSSDSRLNIAGIQSKWIRLITDTHVLGESQCDMPRFVLAPIVTKTDTVATASY